MSDLRLYRVTRTRYSTGGTDLSVTLPACHADLCGKLPQCIHECYYEMHKRRSERPEIAPEVRAELSLKRTQSRIHAYTRENGLDFLGTWTVGHHCRSHKQALDMMSGYLDSKTYGRWLRKLIGNRYLTVAENFSDETDPGAWHIHAAMNPEGSWLPGWAVARGRETWTEYLSRSPWFVPRPDVESGQWRVRFDAPRGDYCSPDALGNYVGKYLTKDLLDVIGSGRRFRRGSGLLLPERESELVMLTEAQALGLFRECGKYWEIASLDGSHIGWQGREPIPRQKSLELISA